MSSSSPSLRTPTRLLRPHSPAAGPAAGRSPPRVSSSPTQPLYSLPSRASVPSASLPASRVAAQPPLSQQQTQQLRSAFALLDRSSLGSLPASLLVAALSGLPQQRPGGGLLLSLLSAVPPSALLSFDELLQLMTAGLSDGSGGSDGSGRQRATQLFALLDERSAGWLDEAELRRLARQLGATLSAAEARRMIERADSDSDGRVSREDFCQLCMTTRQQPL